MAGDNGNVKIDNQGNVEFDNLTPEQLLIILNNKISQLSSQVANLQQRVDDRLVEVATKDDLQRFGERMKRLEARIDEQAEWINERKTALTVDNQSFGAKFKKKLADYAVTVLIVLFLAAIVGGISFYVGNNNEVTELRRQIDELKVLR